MKFKDGCGSLTPDTKQCYTEKQRELLEEQRRNGKFGEEQKLWQQEQDRLLGN